MGGRVILGGCWAGGGASMCWSRSVKLSGMSRIPASWTLARHVGVVARTLVWPIGVVVEDRASKCVRAVVRPCTCVAQHGWNMRGNNHRTDEQGKDRMRNVLDTILRGEANQYGVF